MFLRPNNLLAFCIGLAVAIVPLSGIAESDESEGITSEGTTSEGATSQRRRGETFWGRGPVDINSTDVKEGERFSRAEKHRRIQSVKLMTSDFLQAQHELASRRKREVRLEEQAEEDAQREAELQSLRQDMYQDVQNELSGLRQQLKAMRRNAGQGYDYPTEPSAQTNSAVASTPPAVRAAPPGAGTVKGRLKLLDELKAEGFISEEEYQAKRQAIIDGL